MFLPLRLRAAWNFGGLTAREMFTRTWEKINENEILTRASAVAFYAMLALVPMIALILTVLVQLLPDLTNAAGDSRGVGNMTVGQLEATLQKALPSTGYDVVEDQIKRMQKEPPFGLISLGLLIALWTSSSLFVAIMDSMNRVCGVPETRSFIKLRLTAIVMTLIQAGILLAALIAIVAGPEILQWLGLKGGSVVVATVIQWITVFVMLLMSFALTFYVGPDADQRWEWITPGSVLGVFAFIGFTLLFRLYIQNFGNYDKAYGSLGGVMVLLFWFWVTAVVLLTAGQMNKVIEDASPVGKSVGQKLDRTDSPDYESMTPKPLTES